MIKENILNTYITLKKKNNFSEEMYKELAELSPVGMLTCDRKGNILFANKRVVELMGSPSVEETLRINLFTFHHIVKIGASDHIKSCINDGVEKVLEVHYVSKWGKELWMKINAAPILVDGEVQGARIVIDDVTDLVHHQQLVKENEEHFKVMFEHLADAIWAMNRDGAIRYINEKACSDLGYSKNELLGVGIHELDPGLEEGDFVANFDYIEKEGYLHHIGKSQRKNGELIDIEVHAVCMDLDDEHLVVCSTRNITERLLKEQELLFEKEKSDKANKVKSNFLSNMSHEIRTPINGLMGFLQMLKGTSLDEEQIEYLEWMKFSTDTLLRVVDDVLDMSKIDSGKLKIEENAFSLQELLYECLNIVKFKAMQNQIRINRDINCKSLDLVKGDSFRIQQVVVNLLDNAIKFTEEGGKVDFDVEIENQDDQDCRVCIIVNDTGIGIEPEHLERLFEPFEQYDLSLTRKYGGTGLGLTICKALIELMNGEISVESKIGIGTKVKVVIPVKAEVEEGNIYTKDNEWQNEHLSPKAKVLVVDDCPVNRMLLTKMLEKDDVSYKSAENGSDALELIRQEAFDLIFLDCQLPEIDGYELAKRIRHDESSSSEKIKIIATTAYTSDVDRKKCIEAGMDDYMSKPLDLEQIKRYYL